MPDARDRSARTLALSLGALAALLLGAVAAAWASPEAARFLWVHFAGPLTAQAELSGSATWNGVHAEVGYSLISLIGYGIVLALALVALHALLVERLRVRVDRGFFAVLAPFLAWGPLARALQDTGLLLPEGGPAWSAYLVVEPTVYLTTAALAVAALLADHRVRSPGAGLATLLAFALVPGVLFVAPGLAPAWGWAGVAAGAIAGAAVAAAGRRQRMGGALGLGLGVAALGVPVTLAAGWMLADAPPWSPPPGWTGTHPLAVPLVFLGAALAAVAAVGAVRLLVRLGLERLAPAGSLAAGFLAFAHAFDAVSTIFAIEDPLGWGLPAYGEQNPLSDLLLQVGDGAGFLGVKVLVALAAAALVDDVARNEEGRELAGFLLLAVFALGWGPGARNLLRLAMGV